MAERHGPWVPDARSESGGATWPLGAEREEREWRCDMAPECLHLTSSGGLPKVSGTENGAKVAAEDEHGCTRTMVGIHGSHGHGYLSLSIKWHHGGHA